jgi:hypothetical protein
MKAPLLTVMLALSMFGCDGRDRPMRPQLTPEIEDQLSYFAGGRCIGAHLHDCDGPLGSYHVSEGSDGVNMVSISMDWTDIEDLRRQIHHALRGVGSKRTFAGIDVRLAPKTAYESFDVDAVSVSISTLDLALSAARPEAPAKYTTAVTLMWL